MCKIIEIPGKGDNFFFLNSLSFSVSPLSETREMKYEASRAVDLLSVGNWNIRFEIRTKLLQIRGRINFTVLVTAERLAIEHSYRRLVFSTRTFLRLFNWGTRSCSPRNPVSETFKRCRVVCWYNIMCHILRISKLLVENFWEKFT